MSYETAIFKRYRLPNMFAGRMPKSNAEAQRAICRQCKKVQRLRFNVPAMLRYRERNYIDAGGEMMELDSRVGRDLPRREPPKYRSWVLARIERGGI